MTTLLVSFVFNLIFLDIQTRHLPLVPNAHCYHEIKEGNEAKGHHIVQLLHIEHMYITVVMVSCEDDSLSCSLPIIPWAPEEKVHISWATRLLRKPSKGRLHFIFCYKFSIMRGTCRLNLSNICVYIGGYFCLLSGSPLRPT